VIHQIGSNRAASAATPTAEEQLNVNEIEREIVLEMDMFALGPLASLLGFDAVAVVDVVV
jgi:hypothetical protein